MHSKTWKISFLLTLILFATVTALFFYNTRLGRLTASYQRQSLINGQSEQNYLSGAEANSQIKGVALRQQTAQKKMSKAEKSGLRAPFNIRAELIEKASRKPEAYDQPGEAAEFYRLKRLPEGETEIPVERYFAAREQIRLMPQYSSRLNRLLPSRAELKTTELEAAAWTPLGPGNIGGRTRALLINPIDPQVMYAAGVAGGVWKTVNGGASWTPLSDMLPNLAVNSMAMDPKNPNVIFAGTGEGYFNSDAIRGAGIFKTTDGGATWLRLEGTTGADFYYVNDLVISPTNSQRIYAATRTGVWRSVDGGATWSKVFDPQLGAGCLDLAIRSDQPSDFLFASCGSFQQSAVYRNQDAAGFGAWAEVLKDSGMGRTSIAISPSNQNVIYAAAASLVGGAFQDGLHAIFRSTSSGDPGSWTPQTRNTNATKLNTVLFSNPLAAFLSECGLAPSVFNNQGWYDNVIAVDPIDPNRIWLGGIDLFRSDDGGANWGLASYWWAEKTNPHYAHADHHVITFHPQYNGSTNRQMFIGSDGGIFRTDDARASVAASSGAACNPNASGVAWTSLNNGYGVTQFYHGAVFPDGKTYFGGTQDNGTLIGNDQDGANNWREIFGGDGGYVAVNPNDPNQVYLETTRLSLRKSTDGGKTFGAARTGISESPNYFLFIAPFLMDPSDSQRLYTGGSALWVTDNGAANWKQVSGAGSVGPVSAIAVAPTDSNYLLVGGSGGYIHHTTQGLNPVHPSPGTSNWYFTSPRNGFVSSVTYDPKYRKIAYATYSTFGGGAHVWKSNGGGLHWTELDGSGANRLPDIPVHSLVVDPDNTSRLYIGTDLGVFTSTDGGINWVVENTGFPNTAVESLTINIANGVRSIYAFTHGRGVWRVPLGSTQCEYTLSATRQTVSGISGSSSVNIKAPMGCAWTASSNADWIRISDPNNSSGSGDGTVRFTFRANDLRDIRVGTISITGKSFTVIQSSPALSDTTPPTVTISGYSISTIPRSERYLSVAGSAIDNVGIKRITWKTDRGLNSPAFFNVADNGFNTASNSFASDGWSIEIPSPRGTTNLTVYAEDFSGNVGSATIRLRYNPEYLITTAGGGQGSGYGGDGGPLANALFTGINGLAFDKQGNLYIADSFNNRIRKVAASNQTVTTIAGTGEANYTGDGGLALEAKISSPGGIAFDASSNLYFCDTFNHRIRRIDAQTGIITTIAGAGPIPPFGNGGGYSGDGGPATLASLKKPTSIAVDQAGNIIFADSLNYRIRKVDAATGIITTLFTDAGATVALDHSGNVYFADSLGRRIRKGTADGQSTIITGIGQEGYSGDEGPATLAAINAVGGIATDLSGNIYFTSYGSHTVRKVFADSGIITNIAGIPGFATPQGDNLPGPEVRLQGPYAITLDATGNVFFSEGSKIRKLTPLNDSESTLPAINIVQPTNAPAFATVSPVINLSGTASDNTQVVSISWTNDRGGFGAAAGTAEWTINSLSLQLGVNKITVTAWDKFGNKTDAVLIVTFNPGPYVNRIAGSGSQGFNNDGIAASSAQLFSPESVSFDATGNLYIADTGNHRIRKVARDGTITTFAGNGQLGSRGDGGQAVNAELNSPSGLAVDGSGNVYVADTNNHRVRRVAPSGVITTIAGTGINGFSGDGGSALAAKLNTPSGLALDGAGNLFIADAGNHRIRKLNLGTGVISTEVGNGYGSGGDGDAAFAAMLNFPTAVVFDGAGNLYIADTGNHRIRKVTPSGIISTIAGTGMAGFNGDGGAAKSAQLNAPGGLTLDARGNVYFADQLNHRVRLITVDGSINTVAGTGQPGAGGEGGAALSAMLNAPAGVAVDMAGNLFIADTGNHRVVAITAFRNVASVSAASFVGPVAASEQIVAAFGTELATRVEIASSTPLPTQLAGTSVKVRDSAGNERPAPLFFVSPGQVNYQIPAGTVAGPAIVTITSGGGVISTGGLPIATVAPGLFAANSNGQGVAAAVVLRIKPDGTQIYEPVAVFDPSQNRFIARPIDLGAESDQVFLLLFGTGLRYRSTLNAVTADIGGVNAAISYAGPQGDFVGLDQINLSLSRSLIGRGELNVNLFVDGKIANTVTISLK